MKALLLVLALFPLIAWAETQFGEFQAAPASHEAEWKVKHEEMQSVPQVFAEAAKMAAKMQETAVWEGLHSHVTKGSHFTHGKRLRGGSHMNCGECEALIAVIEGMVRNSTEMNKTITSLDGVCGLVFFGNAKKVSACEDAVKIVTWVFQKLIHLADGLAWNLPLTFCADILKKCTMPCCSTPQVPEQLHLSFASEVDTVSLMRVTWVTLKSTPGAGVYYRVKGSAANFSFAAEEETRTYTQGGWLGVIHTAVMQNLTPDTAYEYYVGEPSLGTSPTWSFNTLWSTVGQGSGRPLRIGAIADMGYGPNSDPTVAALSAMAANGTIDVLLHYGDISYADGDEEHWDDFWRKVEPIAARVPYLTTPGNHEMWWNFSAYKARTGWAMPRAGAEVPLDAMYFTVKIGVLQLLMLDSETWIDTPNLGPRQIQWAGRRLAEANKNRSATPWILSVHHRPLYCTTGMKLQCVVFADFLRGQIEALMVAERVDVGIAGHMHHYERTLPVANGFVTSTSYQNPPSPFYFCNGAAGNREGNGMPEVNQPWSVPSSGKKNVGFQVLHLSSDPTANLHTLTSRFFDSATLEVLDEVTVTKSL